MHGAIMKKLLITGAIIIVIVAATISVRSNKTIHQSETISTPAPDLGPRAHKLLPNLKDALVVVPDRPHDPMEVFSENKADTIQRVRSFTVSTNSLGYRDMEINDAAVDIVCVGDSVTFGWGVAQHEAYPQQLESILDVNVLNTGVPALKPEHVEAYINIILQDVQPKLLLVAMRPNWMTPNPLQGYVQTMRRIHRRLSQQNIAMGVVLPPLASFDPKGRSNNAREVAFLRRELGAIPMLDTTPIFDANLPDGGVALNLQNGVQQMVDRRTGDVLAEGPQPAPPRNLAIEIIEQFEQNKNIKEPLFYDGGHPDAEGFILFGQALADWINELGLLK